MARSSDTPSSRPAPLPFGVILLALFGVVLGGLGVYSHVSGFLTDEQESDSATALLDEIERDLPPEYSDLLQAFRSDPQNLSLLDRALDAAHRILPFKALFNVVSFVLSVFSLVIGVGLFRRLEWARRAECLFLIVATGVGIALGYAAIPGVLYFIGEISQELGLEGGTGITASKLYLYWTLGSVCFIVMHGMIVLYLTRPRVRSAFEKQAEHGRDSASR